MPVGKHPGSTVSRECLFPSKFLFLSAGPLGFLCFCLDDFGKSEGFAVVPRGEGFFNISAPLLNGLRADCRACVLLEKAAIFSVLPGVNLHCCIRCSAALVDQLCGLVGPSSRGSEHRRLSASPCIRTGDSARRCFPSELMLGDIGRGPEQGVPGVPRLPVPHVEVVRQVGLRNAVVLPIGHVALTERSEGQLGGDHVRFHEPFDFLLAPATIYIYIYKKLNNV